jgi:hypothetical protein
MEREKQSHIHREISSPKIVFQVIMGLIKECALIWNENGLLTLPHKWISFGENGDIWHLWTNWIF